MFAPFATQLLLAMALVLGLSYQMAGRIINQLTSELGGQIGERVVLENAGDPRLRFGVGPRGGEDDASAAEVESPGTVAAGLSAVRVDVASGVERDLDAHLRLSFAVALRHE
jgi:hypothetical protein